ncbi:MAG: hypothetical protein ACYCTW_12605 [Sulfuricella sp.]
MNKPLVEIPALVQILDANNSTQKQFTSINEKRPLNFLNGCDAFNEKILKFAEDRTRWHQNVTRASDALDDMFALATDIITSSTTK